MKHSDIFITQNKVIVGIRWAKNEQFKKELLTFSLARLPTSVLCPTKAISKVKQLINWKPDDHLFQLPGGGSLTYAKFQSMFRDKLKRSVLVKNCTRITRATVSAEEEPHSVSFVECQPK